MNGMMKKISKKDMMNTLEEQIKIAYSIVGFDDDRLERIPTEEELHHFEMEIDRSIFLAKSKKHREKANDLADIYFVIVHKLLKNKLQEEKP